MKLTCRNEYTICVTLKELKFNGENGGSQACTQIVKDENWKMTERCDLRDLYVFKYVQFSSCWWIFSMLWMSFILAIAMTHANESSTNTESVVSIHMVLPQFQ